jgi:hypothetical protein
MYYDYFNGLAEGDGLSREFNKGRQSHRTKVAEALPLETSWRRNRFWWQAVRRSGLMYALLDMPNV